MSVELTLDDLLELPNKILEIAEKYSEYADLLSDNDMKEYDLKTIRSYIEKCFAKYKSYRYLSKTIMLDSLNITSNYDVSGASRTKSVSSKVEEIVSRRIKNQTWVKNFYYLMITAATKLTNNEAVYFVKTFFGNKTEEELAQTLKICRTSLQKLKKSSLVKIYVELIALDENK